MANLTYIALPFLKSSFHRARHYRLVLLILGLSVLLFPGASRSFAQGTPGVPSPNFDAATQARIAQADHVVFLIPFSHWDTDWHQTFDAYSKLSDQNILKAIQLAKQAPQFRYTLEQVLFVQHFWDNHPEAREDLKALVQKRQITFAWGGITQPETSLVAPAIQLHNLELGKDWITQTFGAAYVPRTAWQSDAFGNSAAFPTFLSQLDVPYLFIGRWQGRCDPDYQKCIPHPPAFYWTSPAAPQGIAGRVLTTYISYESAWDDIYHRTDPALQLKELRNTTDAEFKQTDSKYLFLPVGFDFADPQANLVSLVDEWNAADQHTILVMSDPDSAFEYLATQTLPEITTDLNPIWQAFYDTRPDAKIADKESEYYLTAADKFGLLDSQPTPTAWNEAALNAHYDNVAGVGFDSVWQSSQYPRFQQTIADAQESLAGRLASIANRVSSPLVVFNPSSWPRSEVVELTGSVPDPASLPGIVQRIYGNDIAVLVQNVPPVGYKGVSSEITSFDLGIKVTHKGHQVTLSNGLVSVTVDGDQGGAFSSLALTPGGGAAQEILTAPGDDITYLSDSGDVYGAFFGAEVGRESKVHADLTVEASGPLLARVVAVFTLGGQQIVKKVTLRANDPLVAVDLDISTLPNTTALSETPTVLSTNMRTDDLGFGAFTHAIDPNPIVSGDVTYRRPIFYPITYWSDVSSGGAGLTLITHGLQGVAGGATRSVMLVREVTSRDEGVTDPGVHHLHYAYLPHVGTATDAQPWLAAYAFNQPLIAAWHIANGIEVQLPYDSTGGRQLQNLAAAPALPATMSLLSADNAVIADVIRQGDQVEALAINYNLESPATLHFGNQSVPVPKSVFTVMPITPAP
ncbi:MAG TPA: glycoside hydrolase family 38 C-terminal domain-containing protein [Aggregatilineales bacterium]|nr:glycoside hydrolase family 38 C-terminal domain-containing protein [Aggregatilineales bacterium]